MKYVSYVLIVLWTIVRKIPIISVPITMMVIPFRAYAHNVVFNYILQNREAEYLQRLEERNPYWDEAEDRWVIPPYHGTTGGYVKYRKVSYLEYKLVYWCIWGWLDADSNHDTFDAGYSQTIVDGERMTWIGSGIKTELENDIANATVFGNTFDLGDKRAAYPHYGFWSVLLWSVRNSGYGFRYIQWEKHAGDSGIFLIRLGKYKFGWEVDAYNPSNYSLVAFGWN